MKLGLDEERDAFDLLTNGMFSLDFLKAITDVIFSEHRNKITVGDFYDEWLRGSGASGYKIPFSLGAIVAYLYCGLVLTKELWDHLVPDDPVSSIASDWSLSNITVSAPREHNPSARYIVRRIRNSLSHGNIRLNVPNGISDRSQLMKRTSVRFHDDNQRDPADVFDAEASLDTLTQVITKFHSEIHRYVREKKA